MLSLITASFKEAQTRLNEFISLEDNLMRVDLLATRIAEAMKAGNKVFSCGNGGSFCDAMHFAEEFTGRFRNERIPLPAIAISDPAHITCVANDYGYEAIFSRYIEGLGKKGDVLLSLSTSGNSSNIIKAVTSAKARGIYTVALLGKDGGKLKDLVDLPIIAPGQTSDRIQEIHIKIIHITIEAVEKLLGL